MLMNLISNSNTQQQNSNWSFGNHTWLNFNDGILPPIILTNIALTTDESSASVSEKSNIFRQTFKLHDSNDDLSKRIIYDNMRNRKPYIVLTSNLYPDTY